MKPRTFLLAAFLIASAAVSAVSVTLSSGSFRAHPADEITYISYASFLKERGISAYPQMVDGYTRNLSNKVVAMSSPLKAGFIAPAAFALRFFRDGFAGLAFLSLTAYLVFVLSAVYPLKKEYDDYVSLLCVFLMAFSPLVMAMSRRALTESLFLCVCSLAIWAFREYSRSGKRTAQAACAVLLLWAILIKETAVLLAVSFMIYSVFRHASGRKGFVWGVVLMCVSSVAAAVVLTFSLGAWRQVVDILTLHFFRKAVATNRYDMVFCSGPWYRSLMDFFVLSPVVFILGISYAFVHMTRRDRQNDLMTFLLILSIVWILALSPYPKNVRYALILDIPIRLGAVLMLKELCWGRPRSCPWLLTSVCVFFLAVTDYARFWSLFVTQGIYDPVTPLLLRAVHILP